LLLLLLRIEHIGHIVEPLLCLTLHHLVHINIHIHQTLVDLSLILSGPFVIQHVGIDVGIDIDVGVAILWISIGIVGFRHLIDVQDVVVGVRVDVGGQVGVVLAQALFEVLLVLQVLVVVQGVVACFAVVRIEVVVHCH
jgi:hypothetical protein